ncbi:MAG: Gfo/Idh/MocA family oxidoreductase, partial [bacterium]
MNKKVGIGVLGAGPLNMTHHIPSIVNNPNCSFEMLCDLNEERLKKCNNLYHPKKLTTNYDEMLNDPDIDLIFIATVPHLQYDLAKKSIEANKHTF